MYKITPTLTATYAEINQKNPLLWEILYKEAEDSFVSQSGLIRCKDFFNELTRKYCTGEDSSIYRFETKTIKLNSEGVYFRLHKICNQEKFNKNLDKVINSNTEVPITNEVLDDKTSLLFIPVHYFSSTYLTSLVSYLIRICNVNRLLTSMDTAVTNTDDEALTDQGKALALKWKFNIPEKYREFWYYVGDKYNSKTHKTPDAAVIVHNNGVLSWSIHVKE